MPDHVHMLVNVPPKLSVSSVVGYIKGKSAIHIARHYMKRERNYAGQSFWARGFFVDTVGRDTELIRRYIAEQEIEDRRLDQMEMPWIEGNRNKKD
jgi:putative transposase